MKRTLFSPFFFLFAILPLLAVGEDMPSAITVNRKQGELRAALRDAEKDYSNFPSTAIVVPELWLNRQKEMTTLLSRMSFPVIPEQATQSGTSMMWKQRKRTVLMPVVTARDYSVGPNGAVIPFSGEFTDSADDLVGLERGGIGFRLQRHYSSFSKYDCGFGSGWNFNYNAGIVIEGEDWQKASQLTMFIGTRDIRFTRNAKEWKTEPGMFLRLEFKENRIYAYTPDLLRYEFELAAEQTPGIQRWRLAKIASRHDQYRANSLTISYLTNCDRIQDITDSFGEKFHFIYDSTGHIRQIASKKQYAEYSYNAAGNLEMVRYAPIKLSLAGTDFQPEVKYQYSSGAVPLLVGKTSSALKYKLSVEYDAQQRVRMAGFVADNQKQMWTFEYRPQNVTVVQAPQPSPEIHYSFVGTPHPSLPGTFEIPTQQAKWQYAFNQDFLLTSITGPLGIRKTRSYDSGNPDVLAHCNIIKEEQFPAPTGKCCGFKNRGTRTKYHKTIALPTEIEYFQVDSNDKEHTLKKEIFTYSDDDLMLICHDDGGIKQYKAHNRFGLPVLEWDANNNVTIFYYEENLPRNFSFAFNKGDVNHGGPLVRIVRDAKSPEITAACKAIGHREIFRNETKRVAPYALETLYAYDPYGNKIHSKSGYNETFSVFSSNGKILVSCDSATGITEYQYYKSGRTDRIYHEFCPGLNASYQGNPFLHFSNSHYYAELFKYDSLDLLVEHQLTDERFQNIAPIFRYERYPNGKAKRITNPMGIARVDEYDINTGRLQKQTLFGGKLEQCLTSEYQYYPDGQVKSYLDQFGGFHGFELDCFGRIISTTDAQGVKTRQELDALDRVTAKSVYYAGKLLSRNEFLFSDKNQKLETEKVYLIDGDRKDVLVSARYIYDKAGNLIGKKGIREDSWQYFLIDGIGNSIAALTPEGDINIKVLRYGEPVYVSTIMHGTNVKTISNGTFTEYDFAGRVIKNTPVDANNKLVDKRRQTFDYNSVGQKIQTVSEQLTRTMFTYNSLGKTLTEEIKPILTNFGEKPLITEYEYRADGQMICKKFRNQALALRGEKNDVKPELVDAPQISEWHYDELGRIARTIQPDGLITSKIYNKSSLPSDMKWTHISEPSKVLRHLSLEYTIRGEVSVIRDGISGKMLRKYAYDKLGNCVSAIDYSNIQPVHLARQFDSLGNMSSEKIEYNGFLLPWSLFKYNLPKGEFSAEWMNFSPDSSRNWQRETRHYDQVSRLTGISLDGKRFANWNYLGNLCEKREIAESRISTQTSYTALLEPMETKLYDAHSNQSIGRFSYDYGPQGQPIFSATKLGEDYNFSSYSQFDSFRRVVGQNGEAVNPVSLSDARKRHGEIFGENSKAIAAVNTSWMAYDQANNIWGRYLGQKREPGDPQVMCNFERMHQFSSPAAVIAGNPNTGIPDRALRELASNRAVSTAMYANDCNLKATEQKYDHLGNLVEYEGTFWNGTRRYPVRWKLTFDSLGRLSKMEATALENMGIVKKDTSVAKLVFAYDAENRRIMKQVIDHTRIDKAVKHTEITLYRGNQQCLIYELKDNDILYLKGEYLWGAAERELLMAALPEHCAENQGDLLKLSRYFFQQDKGLNVVFTSKVENGEVIPVAAESYLGFGDNSTFAKITGIESSMHGINKECAFNRRLDEQLDASWGNPGNNQFMLLQLSEESKLAQLTIWANKFSKNFFVFALPKEERAPYSGNLNAWLNEQTNWENYFAANVTNGKFGDQIMGKSLTSPYRLPLRELKGDKILLVLHGNEQLDINVREFEVCKVADNPSPIAFAGQWLDRETGMYYQINRYRLAGSDKFISPDPIGFLDGNNLYAYAKGNPLEWHDPDGRWVQILAGAGIGAVLGGGMYALNCWLTGTEFSWAEFAVCTFAGAVSGAIAGALFPINPILAGVAAGAAGGAIVEGGLTYLRTGDWQESLFAAGKGALWGAATGAVIGSFGLLPSSSNFMLGLLQSHAIGTFTGGLFGGIRSGYAAYSITGNWNEAWSAAGTGALHGAIIGSVASTAGYSMARGLSWAAGKSHYESKVDRTAFNQAKKGFWQERGRHPVKNDAYVNTRANVALMKSGRAPIGVDGYPVEIHHPTGENIPVDQMDVLTRSAHRLGGNYKLNHPWMFTNNNKIDYSSALLPMYAIGQ